MTATTWSLDRSRLESVACPLCGGTQFKRLAGADRYKMGLVTVGCQDCGLVQTNPQPTTEALDDFYTHHYRRFYRDFGPPDGVPTLEHIRTARVDTRCALTAQLLAERGELRAGMVVLDIGAAEGSMLKAVCDQVPDSRRIAIEPNPTFGQFAKAYAGCEWHPNLDACRAASPPPIDLIIINHVLEHLKHPMQVLESLKPLLATNARIYVEVPDVAEYRKLSMLHIAHLYHFSSDTLTQLAERAGYKVCMMDSYQPKKHPRSLRCVLALAGSADASPRSPMVNHHLGWQEVTNCARHAWFAHAKRWLRRLCARSS